MAFSSITIALHLIFYFFLYWQLRANYHVMRDVADVKIVSIPKLRDVAKNL